ncbi:hypothetical protein HPB47_009925, partial [Ixodes persulcatus]
IEFLREMIVKFEENYPETLERCLIINDSTTCFLERGQNLEVPVEVTRAGSTLRWKFQTSPGHDVDFSITHSIRGDEKQGEQVRQVARIKCDLVPETGQLENLAVGSYDDDTVSLKLINKEDYYMYT